MTKGKVSIGIQTFRTICEEGCYYVGKMAYARRLMDECFYCSPLFNPRCFEKSLFVDTCRELFAGNEPLFRGIVVHDRWKWSVRPPVVRLNFSGRSFTESGHLAMILTAQLNGMEQRTSVSILCPADPKCFGHLIETLHERSGQRLAANALAVLVVIGLKISAFPVVGVGIGVRLREDLFRRTAVCLCCARAPFFQVAEL